MRYSSIVLLLTCSLVVFGCASSDRDSSPPTLTATEQESGTTELLIGLSPVSERVVWASGTGGTFVRTTDGGTTWKTGTVPGADSLQFRDVHAVSADTAYLLSIGPGAQSRIYKTTDGGESWTRPFTNTNPEAFFDCMGFWDAEHGLAFSDAVDGSFIVIKTADGGKTWEPLPADALPPAYPGEASFAASGTCLTTQGDSTAFFSTGAAQEARVFTTTDRGRTWTATSTPIEAGAPAAGIASLTFRDAQHGAALGGIMTVDNPPDSTIANVALTRDGGTTWTLASTSLLPGIFGGTYVPGTDLPTLVAVGPQGVVYSLDDGSTWQRLNENNYWSVAFVHPQVGWAVGAEGRITKLAFE